MEHLWALGTIEQASRNLTDVNVALCKKPVLLSGDFPKILLASDSCNLSEKFAILNRLKLNNKLWESEPLPAQCARRKFKSKSDSIFVTDAMSLLICWGLITWDSKKNTCSKLPKRHWLPARCNTVLHWSIKMNNTYTTELWSLPFLLTSSSLME